MVTGHRPFIGRNMPELTQTIVKGSPPAPGTYNSALSSELEHIILTALALDREQRYPSAGLLAEALRRLRLSAPLPPVPRIQAPRTHIPIQPPKRPSAQQPGYTPSPQPQLKPMDTPTLPNISIPFTPLPQPTTDKVAQARKDQDTSQRGKEDPYQTQPELQSEHAEQRPWWNKLFRPPHRS
ncbi:hypothetical protein [Ktedonobacter sp. SOSP1-85]|uniref:hypothetical protein n=1 Tax=Ktedonobacter sp. SOSP1-85 TaxID=2778367 RepID=UPI001916706D|nr:hypothetical protein [Ktedonobacter sp. SOSP1-85]